MREAGGRERTGTGWQANVACSSNTKKQQRAAQKSATESRSQTKNDPRSRQQSPIRSLDPRVGGGVGSRQQRWSHDRSNMIISIISDHLGFAGVRSEIVPFLESHYHGDGQEKDPQNSERHAGSRYVMSCMSYGMLIRQTLLSLLPVSTRALGGEI